MGSSIPSTHLERFLQVTKEEIVRTWKEDLTKLSRRLEVLEPTSRLPPIPSPMRGKDFVREANVSSLMRAAIEYHNALIPPEKESYIQFPARASDKKLNSDAKDALEMIMIDKLGENYGSLSWATASKTTHFSECEAVIQTAAGSRDFVVFRQSSNFWSIRWLAEQKMKSKRRPSKMRELTREVQTTLRNQHGNLDEDRLNRNPNDFHSAVKTRNAEGVAHLSCTSPGIHHGKTDNIEWARNNRSRRKTPKDVTSNVLDITNSGLNERRVCGEINRDAEVAPSHNAIVPASNLSHVNSNPRTPGPNATVQPFSVLLRLRIKSHRASAAHKCIAQPADLPITYSSAEQHAQSEEQSATVTAPCRGYRNPRLTLRDSHLNEGSSFKVVRHNQKSMKQSIRKEGRGTGVKDSWSTKRGTGRGGSSKRRGKAMKTVVSNRERVGLGA
ncbi:hypothetical protein BWQ96_04797 [Gracilariopsis chorda]|uniref:Uncharacterized protein n=1 Tax=Gracilariopsis chorda TaxID=448386 RepID=A0A2V3ITS7_9FLOR|nr:hypothetical protein BWQ96_04797 [Gracilariopsis chorda]|eukprot:PXF45499.1 hypothetical protein BWQ96_04797 [Gracilariopsis chorda]